MKYFVIFLILIGLVGTSFALTDNLFYGTSSFEILPSSIVPENSQKIEIKFQYQDGPYSLTDLKPIIDVSPKEAIPYVHIEFEPVEEIYHNSIARIYGTIAVDSSIPSEKIFLNVSYVGTNRINDTYKSGWNNSVIVDIAKSDTVPDEPLVPEPSPICPAETMIKNDVCVIANTDCVEGTTYQDGICVVNETEEKHVDPSNRWGGPTNNVKSPLKQFKSGITIDEIQCKESLILVTKHDGSPACVKESTILKLIERGWTAESEIKKLWKSTEDWNSLKLIRNDDGLYCSFANEESSDQCYSLEEIVFGNGFKRTKHHGWTVYPGAGMMLPENSTLTPIYNIESISFLQLDLNAMLDDKIFVDKCESNGGIWNYTYHDCEGIWETCQGVGGIHAPMRVSTPCDGLCLDRVIYRLACVFEYEQ